MRILFIGDVVGRSGREAVATSLPKLRSALRIDLAVVNAENASQLLSQSDVDGGLIGGASLKADAFMTIVQAAVDTSRR